MNLRRRLRTSNAIERVHEEIRRREGVIRIFPNEDSLHRLIGALLMDIHEEWQAGRRYLIILPETSVLPPPSETTHSNVASNTEGDFTHKLGLDYW